MWNQSEIKKLGKIDGIDNQTQNKSNIGIKAFNGPVREKQNLLLSLLLLF